MTYPESDIPMEIFNQGIELPSVPFHLMKFENLSHEAFNPEALRHNFFEIIFIIEGEGRHLIDFTPFEIKPGSVFFIRPGQVHFWETESVKGYALLFQDDFIMSASTSSAHNEAFDMMILLTQSNRLYLDNKSVSEANRLFAKIQKEYELNDVYKNITLRAYLNILLAQFSRINDNSIGISAEKRPLIQTFYRLVAENFIKEKSVPFYAEQMGMTVNYLIDTVKTITGFSPGRVLRHELSLEARRLLVHTDLTAAEIAYHLEFEDPSYFSRFFKRETGSSPSQFRKDFFNK